MPADRRTDRNGRSVVQPDPHGVCAKLYLTAKSRNKKTVHMKKRLRLERLLLGIAFSFPAIGLVAQCTNTSEYPFDAVVPDPLGAVTGVSTCNYLEEYSDITSIISGGQYEFTCTGNAYITVHEGTYDGPVVGSGISPLTITTNSTSDLFAHWNTDDQCGTDDSDCYVTTVQLLLDCTPPTVTATAVDDCDNNQFSLTVNITSLGDATAVDLLYTVVGGTEQTMPGLAAGSYDIGPFTVGDVVNVTVVHNSDPMCNVHLNGLVSGNTCPTIITCGSVPLDQTYCYINYDQNHWLYQSQDLTPLILIFSAGSIESANWDHLTIYDGTDNTGDVVYDHTMTQQEMLSGIQAIGLSGSLYMENSSDGSSSCASGSQQEWIWQVGCLDCLPVVATYTVVTDCDNYQFSVDVVITDLGSDPSLEITNDGGAPTVTATAVGTYTVGPFAANVPVHLTMVNSDNSLCNVQSGELVNPLCPLDIVCGDPPVEETYCYTNNDVHAWHWHGTTPGVGLSIHFTAGTLNGNYGPPYGETLRIYDGPDNTAPLLYEQVSDDGEVDLAGLQFMSTQEDIYMEMTSDGYGSCDDGDQTSWQFEVGCYDCTPPQADYTVVTDCDAFNYTISVVISDMGSDAVVDIMNDGGAAPVPASAPGTYTVGPFVAGTTVNLTLVNDVNSLCNVYSGPLVNPLCPTIVECGTDTVHETYCYTNYDAHAWHWQSSGGQPLYMLFASGTIESAMWDHIKIYDGPDASFPLLYENTAPYPGTDLAGLLVISTGSDLYMTNSGDGSNSCADGAYDAWLWDVGCLDCTNPTATYEVIPDCLHHTYQVAVNVTNTGSDPLVRIANRATGDTLLNVGPGITLTAPIPMDSATVITVLNETNNMCRIFSQEFNSASTDCVIPSCENTAYEYCYTNSDTAWFTYVGTSDTEPLTITFTSGQLLADDYVQFYDGPNTQSPLLYIGNNGGNMAGVAFNSTNPDNFITLRVVSNAQYSCATGDANQPLRWDVLCGYAGISDNTTTSFSMFPNPTTGTVDLILPASVKGNVDLRVFDITGRTVHHEQFNANGGNNHLDLHGLQSGNYTVTITTADNTGAQQLQIVR